ncbi:MAG: helix-turn-helix domain-containing protein [Treponema sp.]|nr:helix-turn-helix domain-containing protein [Treponema sp.]
MNDAKRAFIAAASTAAFLRRKKRETPPVEPKITGEVEAHIIALACTPVPQGYAKWSVRLLADKCVELQYIDSISFKSVQRVLKKLTSNRT